MCPLTMPGQLDAKNYPGPPSLTPGTYSQLVLDTLGEADPNTSAQFLAADDAAVLLSQAGSILSGLDDDVANLGSVQSDLTQQNGTAIAVQLTDAVAAVTNSVNYIAYLTGTTPTPATPPPPPSGTGTTPAAKVTYFGTLADGTLTPVEDPVSVIGWQAVHTGVVGNESWRLELDPRQVSNFLNAQFVTAVAIIDDTKGSASVEFAAESLPTGEVLVDLVLNVNNNGVMGDVIHLAAQVDNAPTWFYHNVRL